jgi:hypothetical protein
MIAKLLRSLWADDAGALIGGEWVLVATVLTLGTLTGLVAMRQAVIAEFHDCANSWCALNQGYTYSGQANTECGTFGAAFLDADDSIVVHSTSAIPWGANNHACD